MALVSADVVPMPPAQAAAAAVTRLGVVRYLNTRPLIAGLEHLQGLRLRGEVPADLIGTLERGETDAALCSSIDFQRSETDLVILPVGLLGCDGPTMTVKIFSRVPLDRLDRLHADADSHTSRVLAQLVLSALGLWVLKRAGTTAVRRARATVARGEIPSAEFGDGGRAHRRALRGRASSADLLREGCAGVSGGHAPLLRPTRPRRAGGGRARCPALVALRAREGGEPSLREHRRRLHHYRGG